MRTLCVGKVRTKLITVSISFLCNQKAVSVHILAAFDARMKEVYWGCYVRNEAGLVELQGEEQVCSPHQVEIPVAGKWCGAGTGWFEYAEALLQHANNEIDEYYADAHPHACDVALLAIDKAARQGMESASQAIPVYLRNKVVHTR